MLPGMGIPSLLRKVFLVDLIQGLKVTFRYQDPKEIYTEQYPMERPQVAERYRGAPRLNVNPDTNETMCIACDLCALACPDVFKLNDEDGHAYLLDETVPPQFEDAVEMAVRSCPEGAISTE